jgi:peptidyl-prolyl cis-trans isomerase B (cyclophilin B)
MNLTLALIVLALAIAGGAGGAASTQPKPAPRVALDTTAGRIVLELAADKAPKTVESFLRYVKAGHYDGTIFHRVIPGFMVQGGGFSSDMTQKSVQAPVQNEADNGLSNVRGSIAMARTSDPHSATSQFFINLVPNTALDHTGKTPQGWGYTVFGKVVEGMEVVDKIAQVQTGSRGQHRDVPVEAVVIRKASLVQP